MRALSKVLMISLVSLLPLQALAADAVKADAKKEKPAMSGMGMAKLDANNDGIVTHDEFIAGSEARFKLMDANGDGKITKEELDAFRQNMRKQHEAMMKSGDGIMGGGRGAAKGMKKEKAAAAAEKPEEKK